MEGVKIYGLCLERLRHQISNAKKKIEVGCHHQEHFLLESYNTADFDDIVDILELYDLTDRTGEQVKEKLEELAYTVSVLTRETLLFDYNEEGYLCLYLVGERRPLEKEKDQVAFAFSTM